MLMGALTLTTFKTAHFFLAERLKSDNFIPSLSSQGADFAHLYMEAILRSSHLNRRLRAIKLSIIATNAVNCSFIQARRAEAFVQQSSCRSIVV